MKMSDELPPCYSCKVFLGGLPYDLTSHGLASALRPFGPIQIEFPHDQLELQGYTYVIFEKEEQVLYFKVLRRRASQPEHPCCHWKQLIKLGYEVVGSWIQNSIHILVHTLLNHCKLIKGQFYYGISSQRMFLKAVEILPWDLAGNKFTMRPTTATCGASNEMAWTIFVGGFHGTVTAEALANFLDEKFGGVIRTSIDTDKYHYPLGSGIVVFDNARSYYSAIVAQHIKVTTLKCERVIQLEPYLVNSMCDACSSNDGCYFCRDLTCFQYFCFNCYQKRHTKKSHAPPLVRKNARMSQLQLVSLTPSNIAAFVAFLGGETSQQLPATSHVPGNGLSSILMDTTKEFSSAASVNNSNRPTRGEFSPVAHSTPSAAAESVDHDENEVVRESYRGNRRGFGYCRGRGRGRGQSAFHYSYNRSGRLRFFYKK